MISFDYSKHDLCWVLFSEYNFDLVEHFDVDIAVYCFQKSCEHVGIVNVHFVSICLFKTFRKNNK